MSRRKNRDKKGRFTKKDDVKRHIVRLTDKEYEQIMRQRGKPIVTKARSTVTRGRSSVTSTKSQSIRKKPTKEEPKRRLGRRS